MPTPKPVMINGIRYTSITQAAKALGLPRATVFKRVNEPSRFRWKDWHYC